MLLEANNEQVWVGGLHIQTGGQLDGLIGGLTKQRYAEHNICTQRSHKIINDDERSILNSISEYIYRNKRPTPDPRFNFHQVVALNFSVFKDALYVFTFCTFTIL